MVKVIFLFRFRADRDPEDGRPSTTTDRPQIA
jgi:hypothetical protein